MAALPGEQTGMKKPARLIGSAGGACSVLPELRWPFLSLLWPQHSAPMHKHDGDDGRNEVRSASVRSVVGRVGGCQML